MTLAPYGEGSQKDVAMAAVRVLISLALTIRDTFDGNTFHVLFLKRSGYGTTHGSSYFKTYSTAPPRMTCLLSLYHSSGINLVA